VSLLEAVPNFSEGRRSEVIGRLTAAADVPGVRLLDVHSDPDHNRTVLTLAGEAEPLSDALFHTIAVAVAEIDLRHHNGVHPRIGAADVVPFVPVLDTPMGDAVAAAHALANRVASELRLPVYLYDAAARRPEYIRLENIRRGGFETLRDAIATRPPDLGPAQVHPSAGAVVIGARQPLIAYNIYLDTDDLAVGRAIARRVRASSGGLPAVKALALLIPRRGQVQISMNLTNFHETSIPTVFEVVREEAAARGTRIVASEFVGLVPLDALLNVVNAALAGDLTLQSVLDLRLLDGG